MTRDDALRRVRAVFESSVTERQMADFVDALTALDVLKVELEDAETNRDVVSFLTFKVVGVYAVDPDRQQSYSRSMALDAQGTRELLQHLDAGGFKVVRK